MASEIPAPNAGIVKQIMAYEGELVNSKDVIMVIEPDDDK